MITPYEGKVYPKIFWRGVYESKHVLPIKHLLGNYKTPELYLCQDVKSVVKKEGDHYRSYPKLKPKVRDYFHSKGLDVYIFKTEEDYGCKYQDSPLFVDIDRVDNGEGKYVGNAIDALYLINRGIDIFLTYSDNPVCTIGFSIAEQKWYGWSHRALYGFGIGYVAKEGDCTTTSGYVDDYIKEHPELDKRLPVGFVCKTLEDCKKAAIAFADAVS